MSGIFRKQKGNFSLSTTDTDYDKRMNDKMTKINDKVVLVRLQGHNMACGVIKYFGGDCGGQ